MKQENKGGGVRQRLPVCEAGRELTEEACAARGSAGGHRARYMCERGSGLLKPHGGFYESNTHTHARAALR